MNPKQKKVWEAVIERDNGLCFCGATGCEVHHIVPRSRCFENLWTLQNMRVVCWSCHHSGIEGRTSEILIEMIERFPEYEDWYRDRAEFRGYLG